MTDLNQYLRRADVEALIDGKIAALDAIVAEAQALPDGKRICEGERRARLSASRDAGARRDALATIRTQLGLCQQFRYRTFRDDDHPGGERHALVAADRDRVPLAPEKDAEPQTANAV